MSEIAKKYNATVGSDAEVFLTTKAGVPMSAIGLIGGSKDHPLKTEHGAVQEDNVLAEFNVDPASSSKDFVNNFHGIFSDLEKIVEKRNGLIVIQPSMEFPEEQLAHPAARIAGCDPDFNAWVLDVNVPPNLGETNLRTASAHIHVAWDGAEDVYAKIDMIKAMDTYLGLPSLLLDPDTRRRELYGKAGAHRPKVYGGTVHGVEWRTGSNFWIKSDTLIEWAFNNAMLALDNKRHMDWTGDLKNVPEIINNNDTEAAAGLITAYNIPMP